MDVAELGRRIRARREQRGLKQQDLAGALRVSPQSVSKWERGENAPDIALLAPLARLLDVTVDWLLANDPGSRDVLQATVMATSVLGAYRLSLDMAPGDFATWANGLFYELTELTLRLDGVPIKYMGDGYLCFFSGGEHRRRAVETAQRACRVVGSDLRVGLHAGEIYVGAVGHPDYARPDIMGRTSNIAFLTLGWAEQHAESGVAATCETVEGVEGARPGRTATVDFRGIPHPVEVCEVLGADGP